MTNSYQVPPQILVSQAKITAEMYEKDSEDNRKKLGGIGVTEAVVADALSLATELETVEASQEQVKNEALTQRNEATAANQAVISWRQNEVLPRAKIALLNDRRLRHFRPGQLRSHRTASVVREGKLLVAAILKFADDPEMQKRGLDRELAEKGRALIARAEQEDVEAAQSAAEQLEISERVYDLEDKLDDRLAEIERCAAAVFPAGSAALKRYRLNEVRNYVAEMRSRTTPIDSTAEITVPDPVPEAQGS